MSLLLDFLFPQTDLSNLNLLPTQPIKHFSHHSLDGVISVFKYQGSVKNNIIDLKFNFVYELAPRLASVISNRLFTDFPNILRYWQENNFTLVPIPLHPLRQNWRGFNQSELICQYLSISLNLDYQSNILIRHKNTRPQTKITNKLHRQSNLATSFKLLDSNYQRIILVDDVCTTGATLISAASVFPKKSNLWGLTIAG